MTVYTMVFHRFGQPVRLDSQQLADIEYCLPADLGCFCTRY